MTFWQPIVSISLICCPCTIENEGKYKLWNTMVILLAKRNYVMFLYFHIFYLKTSKIEKKKTVSFYLKLVGQVLAC